MQSTAYHSSLPPSIPSLSPASLSSPPPPPPPLASLFDMPATLQPHRTWGTRYDSLVDAVPVPSPSPPSLRGSSNINNTFHTCQHDNSMSNIAHVQSMHSATSTASFPLHEDAAKERVRAPSHQQLSNTPTSHPERPYQYSQHPNPYSPSRMPHDASVFVARYVRTLFL